MIAVLLDFKLVPNLVFRLVLIFALIFDLDPNVVVFGLYPNLVFGLVLIFSPILVLVVEHFLACLLCLLFHLV